MNPKIPGEGKKKGNEPAADPSGGEGIDVSKREVEEKGRRRAPR